MCDVLPDEALRVRSAYLRNDIQASSLVAEARRRASALAVQAQGEAEQLYLAAKAEGYADGILLAAQALTDYLAEHGALAARLQEKLQQRVATLLQYCVNEPDVVMAAFEECLAEQDLSAATRLDLLLPDSMRAGHRGLLARLQQHAGVQVNVEYHKDQRFLLRLGDQVAEFAPGDFVANASARAMGDLPSIHAASAQAAKKCRAQLSALFAIPQEQSDSSPTLEKK